MNESGKVAIVTGGGSGIGRASAQALLADGYSVAIAGRRPEPLAETISLAGPLGRQMIAVPSDVTDPESIRALFDQTVKTFGRVDLLFNNAGVGAPPVALEDLSIEDWRRVVDINLTGVFLGIREAFRVMKAQSPQGGRIINNGSISSQVPRPNSAPYTATKHAVTGLTRSAALDGRKYNIACGQIDIGNADTEMANRMKAGILQANGKVAVEPTMDVQHVARAIVSMASLPLDANVLFMTIMATTMPLVGRG